MLCSHDKYQKDISTVNIASYIVFVSIKVNVYCEANYKKYSLLETTYLKALLYMDKTEARGLERGLFYDCCGAIKNFLRSNPSATYEKEISPSTKTQIKVIEFVS